MNVTKRTAKGLGKFRGDVALGIGFDEVGGAGMRTAARMEHASPPGYDVLTATGLLNRVRLLLVTACRTQHPFPLHLGRLDLGAGGGREREDRPERENQDDGRDERSETELEHRKPPLR